MSTKVKRQHYVWRNYLRAWAEKESIHTFLKDKNKATVIKLMGVAQERYFYEMEVLTDVEFKFIESIIKDSPEVLRGLHYDFLMAFKAYRAIKEKYDLNPKPEIEGQLIEIEKNTMELIYGKIEHLGGKLVDCRTYNDVKIIFSDSDNKNQAILFLCVQYFRTRKMKDAVTGTRESSEFKGGRIWNLLSLIMAHNVARNLAVDDNLRIRVYENKTDMNFLTSDQPVINLHSDDLDERGNVKKLEFYYPLNPSCAISVHYDESQKDRVENILVNEAVVEYFNTTQRENALKFIFSNNLKQVESIVNI